jgi:hypothetical protein
MKVGEAAMGPVKKTRPHGIVVFFTPALLFAAQEFRSVNLRKKSLALT